MSQFLGLLEPLICMLKITGPSVDETWARIVKSECICRHFQDLSFCSYEVSVWACLCSWTKNSSLEWKHINHKKCLQVTWRVVPGCNASPLALSLPCLGLQLCSKKILSLVLIPVSSRTEPGLLLGGTSFFPQRDGLHTIENNASMAINKISQIKVNPFCSPSVIPLCWNVQREPRDSYGRVKLQYLFWRWAEVKIHIQSDHFTHVYYRLEYFLGTWCIWLHWKSSCFLFCFCFWLFVVVVCLFVCLFWLDVVLAPKMRDVDGVLYFEAFFRADQADPLLFHFQLPESCLLLVLKSPTDCRSCREELCSATCSPCSIPSLGAPLVYREDVVNFLLSALLRRTACGWDDLQLWCFVVVLLLPPIILRAVVHRVYNGILSLTLLRLISPRTM